MLSSVLNSDRAVQMNILIMRVFVKLRELLATHKDLARKIEHLEASQRQQARTQAEHGSILVAVVQNIQRLKHPHNSCHRVCRSQPQEEVTGQFALTAGYQPAPLFGPVTAPF
jgi:hypothetical protein